MTVHIATYDDWSPVRTTIAASIVGIATWATTYPLDIEPSKWVAPPAAQYRADGHEWLEATEATGRAQPADLDALVDLFDVANADPVREFLATRAELLSLAAETFLVAAPKFPNARFVLEQSEDPESDRIGLSLTIISSDSPENILAAFDRFDEEWWLANMNRADGLLAVNAQYV